MAVVKDYTKGSYKKYRVLLRTKEDADMLNDLKLFTDAGGSKIDWVRNLCKKLR